MFLAPSLAVLALVAGWPLARTIWFSLTDANLSQMEAAKFVGFANFKDLFADERWWTSVWTTFRFALVSVTLETALKRAAATAEAGDVVLLAPACASFDQFKNYEHRGRVFKEVVRALATEARELNQ